MSVGEVHISGVCESRRGVRSARLGVVRAMGWLKAILSWSRNPDRRPPLGEDSAGLLMVVISVYMTHHKGYLSSAKMYGNVLREA